LPASFKASSSERLKVSNLLAVQGVSKSYGSFLALSGVSFAVGPGEFVAIVGPNGAGKTTLVNIVTGLLRPSKGEVRFKDRDIAGVGPVELTRRGMARTFQLVQIFPTLTVRETLSIAIASRPGIGRSSLRRVSADKAIRAECEFVAGLFKLSPLLDMPAGALSQGEKKLLDIASAFTLQPELILLDEPTSGVSTSDKHIVMQVLLQAAQSAGIRSIVLIEHDMELVSRYSKRIIAMQEGRVLADMATAAFFANDDLVAAVAGKPPIIATGAIAHALSH
jgi:branched-chain amino acid transport system ATP-binding protein